MLTTKKQRDRETKILSELQSKHGFLLMRVKRDADRYVSTFKRKPNGKLTYATKYVVQFAVPIHSALGKAMIENDKVQKRKSARR